MKVVVVGGVAGGASAAARLRRLDEANEILILERGAYVSYANCGLPYYIGGVIRDRGKLFVQTPERFDAHFNIQVRTEHEVLGIDAERKVLKVHDLASEKIYEESFDKLILSPGAEALKPPIPGIDSKGIFTLRSVPDTDAIADFVKRTQPKHATVIGGGFIGLEMAENFHHLGIEVTLVEALPQVMAPLDFEMVAPVHAHLREKGVDLRLGSGVSSFEELSGERALKLTLQNGQSFETDLVMLSIGVRPDVKLAREAGLKIGETGGIWVDEFLKTSHPDIYAAGDAIEFPHAVSGKPSLCYLAGPANKQGRIVADNLVLGDKVKYKGCIGTAIAKVFDWTVATTGLNEKTLTRLGIPFHAIQTHSGSHAGYYPGAESLAIKTLISPEGKLLGAQVVGKDGVDKRIDLFAAVLGFGGSLQDLTEIEHAYAPPFSSAKDPVNIAGFVAENLIEGRTQLMRWNELEPILDRVGIDFTLIDARTPEEHAAGSIPGALNIPVYELRDQLDTIAKDRPIVVYCGVGLRAYHAERVIRSSGRDDVRNLTGGWKTWSSVQSEKKQQEIVFA